MKAVLKPFGFLRAYSFKLVYWFRWHLPKHIISSKLLCGKWFVRFLKKGPLRISLKIDEEPNSIYFKRVAHERMFGENCYLWDIYQRHMEAFQLDPIRLLNFIYVARDILSVEKPTQSLKAAFTKELALFYLPIFSTKQKFIFSTHLKVSMSET